MLDKINYINDSDFSGLMIKPVLVNELYGMLCKFLPFKRIGAKSSIIEVEIITDEIVKPEKLFETLQTDCTNKWEILKNRQTIAELNDFANQLKSLGQVHNSTILMHYGEKIIIAADSFNVEKIISLINDFPELIIKLKTPINTF
jgi:hypothetical protein